SLSTITNGSNGINTAIAGNLTIGDTLAGNALVQWLNPHQVVDTSSVTVNSDGTLDLNGRSEQIAPLTILDGLATTGATGSNFLAVSSLSMTGGTINLTTALSRLILGGDVTATSSAAQTATITGSGHVLMAGTRTFTVNAGAKPI